VPHDPERRNQTDEKREADALGEEDEHTLAAFSSAGLSPCPRPHERHALAGGDDPASLSAALRLCEQLHVPPEVLHRSRRGRLPTVRGKQERGPYHAEGHQEQPTQRPCPLFV